MSDNKKVRTVQQKDDKIMMMYKEKSDKMDNYSKRLEEKIQKLSEKIESQNGVMNEKNKMIKKLQMDAEQNNNKSGVNTTNYDVQIQLLEQEIENNQTQLKKYEQLI